MSIQEKLTQIAENEQRVFDAGKKSEYDTFWDAFQQDGNRKSYHVAFSNLGWTDATFKPKYPIVPEKANSMFWGANIVNLSACGTLIDFSQCNNLQSAFQGYTHSGLIGGDIKSGVTHVDIDIDCSSLSNLNQTFSYNTKIKTIKKLIVHEDLTYTNAFVGSGGIANITFEGTIGNSISINTTGLTLDSAKSILTALKDFTGTDKEFANTVTLHANAWTRLDNDGATAPTGTTWRDYVTAKCWNM